MIDKNNIRRIYDSKYMKLYDVSPEPDEHYYVASRRDAEDLPATKTKEDYKTLLPDAVSCIVVLKIKGQEPKLLLSREYRYPAGQYLLSVPAGLIDPEDKMKSDAILQTAIRELKEETGIEIDSRDTVKVVNPYLFSSPGLTDEGNALVYVEINRDVMPKLSQEGAVGMEKFNGNVLLTKEEAQNLLVKGRDEQGVYYPVWTWAALMFFMGV